MAGADFQVTSEAGWPLVSPQKVESPSRQWPGALPIEVNSKRSKTPLDSALSSPLDFNRYDPLKVYIAPRQLEEVESAIFADYRDSGGLRGTIKMGRRRNQGQVGDPLSVRPRAKGRQGAQRKGFVTWSID